MCDEVRYSSSREDDPDVTTGLHFRANKSRIWPESLKSGRSVSIETEKGKQEVNSKLKLREPGFDEAHVLIVR